MERTSLNYIGFYLRISKITLVVFILNFKINLLNKRRRWKLLITKNVADFCLRIWQSDLR